MQSWQFRISCCLGWIGLVRQMPPLKCKFMALKERTSGTVVEERDIPSWCEDSKEACKCPRTFRKVHLQDALIWQWPHIAARSSTHQVP